MTTHWTRPAPTVLTSLNPATGSPRLTLHVEAGLDEHGAPVSAQETQDLAEFVYTALLRRDAHSLGRQAGLSGHPPEAPQDLTHPAAQGAWDEGWQEGHEARQRAEATRPFTPPCRVLVLSTLGRAHDLPGLLGMVGQICDVRAVDPDKDTVEVWQPDHRDFWHFLPGHLRIIERG